MNNSTECGKALTKLLKKLGPGEPPEDFSTDVPEAILVQSYLLWETTAEKARAGYDKIMTGVVDFNDLRVTLPHEVIDMIGVRYPDVEERTKRMRATIRDIFNREHGVHLKSVTELGKRDVKKYIESLDGIPSYVASRLQLIAFGAHSIPVDEHLRAALINEGAADESVDVAELSLWLTRQIKAGDGLSSHYALQAWVETNAVQKSTSSKRKTKTKTKTKTTGKTTGKTKSSASAG